MCQSTTFVVCPPRCFSRGWEPRRGRSQRIAPPLPGSRTLPRAAHRRENDESKRSGRRSRRAENDSRPSSPGKALGPTPGERHGFHGWRAEDDEYWRELRRQEKAFRGPHIPQFDPENESYAPPKNREGKDIEYAAQVRWDPDTETFVPTTEEEEEEMRRPDDVLDPFWVEEAAEGEAYRPNWERTDQITDQPINIDPVLYRVGPPFEGDRGDGEEFAPDHDAVGSSKAEHAGTPVGGAAGAGRNAPKVANTKRRRLGLAAGDWRVVHLGTSSAIPTRQRNVSSTAFIGMPPSGGPGVEPHMVLVDAGENTENRLLDAVWCMSHGFRWIRAIVITHLHGDHIYGLPGLLRGIAEYCQFRRRPALEGGEEDPVIRIFGPYGTRGFLRSALFWTVPLGVRFAVSELVPRDADFPHIGGTIADGTRPKGTALQEVDAQGNVTEIFDDDPRFLRRVPPPHPEEVRAEDVRADEDGVWRIWGDQGDEDIGFEVVAAPLKHRLPCFGYVFRGRKRPRARAKAPGEGATVERNGVVREDAAGRVQDVEIDVEKARALGVYGSQFRVLRSGRSVVVRKSGRTVCPEDVMVESYASPDSAEVNAAAETMELESEMREGLAENGEEEAGVRKVVVLGDTCNSRLIAPAAMDADVLIHEATFANALKAKALQALHSTAGMAGEFAREIRAKKLVLTHFSSRYEGFCVESMEKEEWNVESDDGDLISAKQLVKEAGRSCAGTEVVAAQDFMEHSVRADGVVETRDQPFNRYLTYKVYEMFWKTEDDDESESDGEVIEQDEEDDVGEQVADDTLVDAEEVVAVGE